MTRRKDGTWQQAMTVTIRGRKTQKYFYGKTKGEVLAKIQAYKDDESLGPLFVTVADEWWEQHEPTIATNTTKSYKPALRRAKENFKTSRIREITPADVSKFLRKFIKEQNPAQKTAATQLMIVNLICSFAVENCYIQINPVREVSLPKNLPKTQRKLPEPEDLKRVKASADAPFGMFAYWTLYTGCRRGELQALTWEDVDIENGWIHITKTLYYKEGKPTLKAPKTKSGVRDIPLMTRLAQALTPGKGIIFANETGGYLTESQFQKKWAEYREATGVTCTPHQLRHAYATMLWENEIQLKDAQTLLGHAQASTTLDIYTHIRKTREAQLQQKLLDLDIKSD